MSTESNRKINAPFVRALLERRDCPAPFHLHSLYAWIGAAPGVERKSVYNAIRDLARAEYLNVVRGVAGTTYQVSGKGMPRTKLTDEELLERKRIRNARRTPKQREPGAQHTRAARVAMQAANTPVPATPAAARAGETVEQFQARGGRVQRLATHWEQMERAA